MRLSSFLRSYIVVFALFLLLDIFWHGMLLQEFYGERLIAINPLLAGVNIGLSPFILFVNALNALTLTYITSDMIISGRPVADVLWTGMLIGFTVVATVNALNHTFIPRWDIVLVLVDSFWGAVVGLIGALTVAMLAREEHRSLWARVKGMLGR